ncbi:UNVERIFIED_ORG: hypothetical protein M2312_005031 [Rhizobium esperanzae]|nr:hypothetical protein [Rhizobium esperanzae]PCD69907.1 hypothetical protein CO648_05200 [Rhizobium phaseoli]
MLCEHERLRDAMDCAYTPYSQKTFRICKQIGSLKVTLMTEEEFERELFRTLENNDTLAIVVKSAIFIETEIIELINGAMHNPSALNGLDLTYHQRCGLAIAVGLNQRFSKPLKAIGTIRNKFAHRVDAQFGKDQADNLYDAFDPVDKSIINKVGSHLAKHRNKPFSKLDPMERFVICVIALRAAIVYAQGVQSGKHVQPSEQSPPV